MQSLKECDLCSVRLQKDLKAIDWLALVVLRVSQYAEISSSQHGGKYYCLLQAQLQPLLIEKLAALMQSEVSLIQRLLISKRHLSKRIFVS